MTKWPCRLLTRCVTLFLIGVPLLGGRAIRAAENEWRSLPLIQKGAVDPAWQHVGWGKFVVEDGAIRTEPSERGLGLLVYTKEPLGNCQIRVVYRPKNARCNAGIH